MGIGPRPAARTLRVGSQHVVINQHVAEAQPLGGLDVITDGRRVVADLRLWKNHTDLHRVQPARIAAPQ